MMLGLVCCVKRIARGYGGMPPRKFLKITCSETYLNDNFTGKSSSKNLITTCIRTAYNHIRIYSRSKYVVTKLAVHVNVLPTYKEKSLWITKDSFVVAWVHLLTA